MRGPGFEPGSIGSFIKMNLIWKPIILTTELPTLNKYLVKNGLIKLLL